MEKHLPRLLDMGVTALICGQDTIANAALVQCQQLGYKLPRDLSIIERQISHDIRLLYSMVLYLLNDQQFPV